MVETSAPPTKYGNLIIVQFMAMVKPLERLKMSSGFTVQGRTTWRVGNES
jgi:hypothetical protein